MLLISLIVVVLLFFLLIRGIGWLLRGGSDGGRPYGYGGPFGGGAVGSVASAGFACGARSAHGAGAVGTT